MKGSGTYTAPVLAAFAALIWPLLATMAGGDEPPNLTGLVISNEKPGLNKADWFSGNYQELRDDYNNDHWAYKEPMVRLNNQLEYDLFNQIRVKSFVSGKDDYVFSEMYIFSAFGDDLLERKHVAEQMRKAKVIQDTLKKMGIDLLLVFAPGKGMGCREFIEEKYVHPVKITNHDLFVDHSAQAGVNTLDLYAWFDTLKPDAPYPLFPRFGHHWSYYGECLAVDTIIKHISHLHGKRLPRVSWEDVALSDTARFRDADVVKSMNLWKEPDQRMKLGYPEIRFEGDSTLNTTKVLTISDSYWYGPVYMGVGFYAFAGGQFWYYNNKVVPAPGGVKTEVWELDLRQAVEDNEVIMLLYSDANLTTFGNGFIEEVYEMYTSPERYEVKKSRRRTLNTCVKQIRESPALLRRASEKSERMGITLDSAIVLDALKLGGIATN